MSVTSLRAVVLAAMLVGGGCTTSGDPAAECRATILDGPPPDEIRVGTIGSSEVWALAYDEGPDVRGSRVGETVKIIWRMPVGSTASFWAESSDGTRIGPTRDPKVQSSDWDPDGSGSAGAIEFGTIWIFDSPGCWSVVAQVDGDPVGRLSLEVA